MIAVRIEGAPNVDPPVVAQDEDGTLLLDYVPAITSGKTAKRFNRRGRFHISNAYRSPDARGHGSDVLAVRAVGAHRRA